MKDENEHMDEFERLIQTAAMAEQHAMRDDDWNQLQSMLDTRDRRRVLGWLWKGALGVLGFIAIGIGVNLLELNDEVNNGPSSKQVKAAPVDASADKHEDERLHLRNADAAVTEKDKVNDAAEAKPFIPSRNQLEDLPVSPAEEQVKNDLQATPTSAKDTSWSHRAVSSAVESRPEPLIQELSPQVSSAFDQQKNSSSIPEAVPPASTGEVIAEEPSVALISKTDSLATQGADSFAAAEPLGADLVKDSTEIQLADIAQSDSIAKTRGMRRLHAYAGAGVEWSSASRLSAGPARLKLNLGAEYLLRDRLSMLAGVSYTAKAYQTTSDDYTVEKGFWTNGTKPESIEAECRVIGIPVNLRYYFTPQDQLRSSVFVMAGASSYLMASERYQFSYEVEDPALRQEWGGEWESMHYFSILSFSAGYQRRIHPRWAVLLEPYVHLPLSGVGFGAVNLMSFGMSVQLKH